MHRVAVMQRMSILVAGLWGTVVSSLLLLTAFAHPDDTGIYFWAYYSVTLAWYLVLLFVGQRRYGLTRSVRFSLMVGSVVLALAGGLGGLVFFGVSLLALVFSCVLPDTHRESRRVSA